MHANNPKILTVIGALMLISGWAIAFLTVIKIIEENLYLIILAYGINLVGLFIGLYGVSSYIYVKRREKKQKK
ncbi:MAG: hypothetical protein DRO23_03975 [Thermoprotei archaeon]|nr:MAG: hypothetical protein DRO23_03975 [Thermoprotei archaeon]